MDNYKLIQFLMSRETKMKYTLAQLLYFKKCLHIKVFFFFFLAMFPRQKDLFLEIIFRPTIYLPTYLHIRILKDIPKVQKSYKLFMVVFYSIWKIISSLNGEE